MRARSIALFASLLLVASSAFAARAVTAPVGFTRHPIRPGAQTLALSLVNPAVVTGTVERNGPATFTLDTAGAPLSALLDESRSYYLEIEAGPVAALVGERFEIDVASTRASGESALALRSASGNTAAFPLPAGGFAGFRATIRRHLTLGQVFGCGASCPLESSADFARADQVLLFDRAAGAFTTYYLHRTREGACEWRQVGSAGRKDDTVIPPGAGVFFRRNGTAPIDWTVLGGVRTNDFVLPLAAGYNFVSLPLAGIAVPLRSILSSANGFVSAADVAGADQLLVFNGAAYDTYFLHRAEDGAEAWRKVGAVSAMSDATGELLAAGSVFIRKLAADPDFVAPCLVAQ